MDDFSKFIVGAYATSPTLLSWNEKKEINFIQAIRTTLNPIYGLELPFYGDSIHLHDETLFLSLLDKNWNYVMTSLPGVMMALENNIHFGLASDNINGRKEAINFYKQATQSIKKINRYFGTNKVHYISLATAPSLKSEGVSSSMNSLEISLEELLSFDWSGAKIVIEHCDSGRIDNPVKGFLSIEEEIEVIQKINSKYNADIGLSINWARSAIEFRNEDGANKHIKKVLESNMLSGLIFSGTGSRESEYGKWSDLHMPVAKENYITNYENTSLLSKKNIYNCLIDSNYESLDYIGIKVLAMPISDATLERRIGINRDAMNVINQAIKEIKNEL